jgi:endonuclease/exonuclease/phosphatase (EEP) superfamily protein YafD
VRYLIEDGIPSIVTAVDLPHCPNVQLYCLHPRPPRPEKAQDSTNRDAELVVIGHQVRGNPDPTVVAGDLNDVAWSYTTDLFLRVSGLLDPRRGRGMYNTFNARNPLLRFPLDHVFHSAHFRLVRLQRLPDVGSDHFPILVELSFEESAVHTHNTPEADSDDLAMSRELRERARRRS